MHSIGKEIKSETSKFLGDRFALIWILAVLGLVILMTNFLVYQWNPVRYSVGEAERQSSRKLYLQEIERLQPYYDYYVLGDENALSYQPDKEFEEENRERYREQYLKYKYFLSTNTISDDFVNVKEFRGGPNEASIMLQGQIVLGYVWLILAVFLAAHVFGGDLSGGSGKHVLAAPMRRKEMLLGKSAFLALLLLAFWCLPLICGVVWELINPGTALVYYGNQHYAVSCFSIFLSRMIGLYINMLLLGALTALLTVLTRKQALATVLTFLVFLAIAGSCVAVVIDRSSNFTQFYECTQYFPIMNIQNYEKGFGNWVMWVMWIAHLLPVVACVPLMVKKFRKMDMGGDQAN